ncbi:nucleotidyl transferase AbiEii/AbiGii toxin family protein [Candidatus Bipolaricaulota bacterium]|nr:nucleotidyl transferase AbiEii/AbiGii toxin family protein [Candidatus Bipolaricaulota bacterium]
MIREAEVRRLAGGWGVDPVLVDLDYVLGCFLASLYRQEWAKAWLFKGGTCLRKCYYPGYRFSEDLDFTATRRLDARALEERISDLVRAAEGSWQIDFSVRPPRVEVIEDEYGKETYQARIYYRGPLRRAGDPRAIRLDVTLDERVVFPPSWQEVIHPYSDKDLLSGVRVPCYSLSEVLAEKVRALAGQRRYAIARDLYDIAQLLDRTPVDIDFLARALPIKMTAKGLPPHIDLGRLKAWREEFKADWQRNLTYLLPPNATMGFDTVWAKVLEFLAKLAKLLTP